MISARMRRLLSAAVLILGFAVLAGGCGTEKISLAPSDPNYAGAVLFNQRCSGCHTLSYAATHGSAAKVTTAQYNNGPNFDVRCERPIARVLYAIENGGFSGAIMPQNIVVGQQAMEVARFVATYAGRKAPEVPGQASCAGKSIGTIPASATTTATSTTPTTATTAAGPYASATPTVTTPTSKKTTKGAKRKR
jgi:mono/diheme cytochrome c family protein